MDHLALAREELRFAHETPVSADTHSGLAIAHALIALVERLDALTVTDDSGKAALRTFRTVEL